MYMNVAEGGGFLGDFRHTARADPLTDPAGAQKAGGKSVAQCCAKISTVVAGCHD